MAEGGGRGECPERGEGTQGGHGDGPTLWQVEGPRSAGERDAAQPPWDKGWSASGRAEGLPRGCCPQARQGSGEAGSKQGPSRLPWACVGLRGVVIASISKAVTPRLFQFFAFITTLLYILHAFSIYYH